MTDNEMTEAKALFDDDTKHTRGPWTIVNHNWSDTSIYGADHSRVASLKLGIEDDTDEEAIKEESAIVAANARLIAAAPELYAALELAENTLDDLRVLVKTNQIGFAQDIPDVLEVIRLALAKARGK